MSDKYEELMKNCPILYSQRKLPMTETCMCWGITCGEGWYEPLAKLSVLLESYNHYYKRYNLCVQASQVKEKFGTLRFYYDIVNVPCLWKKLTINILSFFINNPCCFFHCSVNMYVVPKNNLFNF
jgi:hypothetical protein